MAISVIAESDYCTSSTSETPRDGNWLSAGWTRKRESYVDDGFDFSRYSNCTDNFRGECPYRTLVGLVVTMAYLINVAVFRLKCRTLDEPRWQLSAATSAQFIFPAATGSIGNGNPRTGALQCYGLEGDEDRTKMSRVFKHLQS